MTHTTDSMASSKKPIHLFLLLVTIFAAIGYTVAFKMGDENRTGGVFLVQFAPLVAAFITKLVFQRNLRVQLDITAQDLNPRPECGRSRVLTTSPD